MINQKYQLLKKGGKVKRLKQKQKQKQKQTNTQIVKVNVNTVSRRRRAKAKRSSSEKREEVKAKPSIQSSISLSVPNYTPYNPVYSQIPNTNRSFNVQDIRSIYDLIKQHNDDMLREKDKSKEPQENPEPELSELVDLEYPADEEFGEHKQYDDEVSKLKHYYNYIERIQNLYNNRSHDFAHKKLDLIANIYEYQGGKLGNLFRQEALTAQNLEDMITENKKLTDINSRKEDKKEKRKKKKEGN